MSKILVVVESPSKAKTIEKFLGKNYVVKASMGHLRDLPKSQFGVDVEQDFEPKYINIRGKGDLIKALRTAAKNSDKVYLATDPDREGEAIAWHLAYILNINPNEVCRIEFNEITKPAIQGAVKNARPINLSRVDAQQTRRILDRIVGYKLSPLLWKKVRKGLSAGRVQSVAVKLICEREKEVNEFVSEEYWSIDAKLKGKTKASVFEASLVSIDKHSPSITNKEQANLIKIELEKQNYIVKEIKKKERRRNALAPFITSTLQQDAYKKFGFTSRKTMMVAQQLYEGLPIGAKGQVGLITYMRTDSTRISETALNEVRQYISTTYGESYIPSTPNVFTTKKAQDAHEAIRPTSIEFSPTNLEKYLNKDQLKLYKLIWDRFVSSQMTQAIYDTMTVEIEAGQYGLRANGSNLKFAGFLALYEEAVEDSDKDKSKSKNILPDLTEKQVLTLNKILPNQHFTQPPPRFTEASLVKLLEEKGIGRPSTYAPIIDTIVSRGYVVKIDKRFEPTDLGILVIDLLKQYFKDIVNVEFTAKLEDDLDNIAEGKAAYKMILKNFYKPFAETLAKAEEEIGHVELPVEESDEDCELCGRRMIIKTGRFGSFLACPGFPDCKNTKPLLKEIGVSCPKCGGKVVERRTKRGKKFFGCEKYPECDFVTWNMPINEKCKKCGAILTRQSFKNGGSVIKCSNNCDDNKVKKEQK